jgi:hypothetical protein
MTAPTTSLMTALVVDLVAALVVTLAVSMLMLALVESLPLTRVSVEMVVALVMEASLLMPTTRWLLGRLLWFVHVLFCRPKVLES